MYHLKRKSTEFPRNKSLFLCSINFESVVFKFWVETSPEVLDFFLGSLWSMPAWNCFNEIFDENFKLISKWDKFHPSTLTFGYCVTSLTLQTKTDYIWSLMFSMKSSVQSSIKTVKAFCNLIVCFFRPFAYDETILKIVIDPSCCWFLFIQLFIQYQIS